MRGSALPPAQAADGYSTSTCRRTIRSADIAPGPWLSRSQHCQQKLLQAAEFTPDRQLNASMRGLRHRTVRIRLAAFAAHLTGVDLSPAMVEKARASAAVMTLVVAELTDYLGPSPRSLI